MLGQEAVGAGPGPPRWRRAVPLPLEAVGSVQRGQGWGLRRRGLCARRLGYVTQASRSVARRQVPLWATVLPCAHRHGPERQRPSPAAARALPAGPTALARQTLLPHFPNDAGGVGGMAGPSPQRALRKLPHPGGGLA